MSHNQRVSSRKNLVALLCLGAALLPFLAAAQSSSSGGSDAIQGNDDLS
jgi:hypothetical protein